jgi:peptidoglycan hydrolase CwlO-like protein
MHAHHEVAAREVIAAQTQTIALLQATLKRTIDAMSVQSDATATAVAALVDAAHAAAQRITSLKADKAALEAENASLRASAENAGQLADMEAAAEGAAAELNATADAPAEEPAPDPQPEPQPEG